MHDFPFDRLYKHCESRFLPEAGRKLRIGTLSDYRTHENEKVRDIAEGKFFHTLRFDGSRLIRKSWLSDICFGVPGISITGIGEARNNVAGGIFVGSEVIGVVQTTDDIRTIEFTADAVRLEGSLNIEFEGCDAFVFCISTKREHGSVINDDDYDACWSISADDLGEFQRRMAISLISKAEGIKEETIGPVVSPPFDPFRMLGDPSPSLRLHPSFSKIIYRSKSALISEGTEVSREEIKNLLDCSARTKPLEFESESEYRFIFQPSLVSSDGQRMVPLPNYCEARLIDCEPFLDLIRIE